MKKYESPKIVFEGLELFEKIADKCWGWGKAVFKGTDPSDGIYKVVEVDFTGNGCDGGYPSVLKSALNNAGLTDDELLTMIKGGSLSSLANTQATNIFFPEKS